ncbi:MAG: 30S ribosomal protein S1 [Candidatus Omnitrophica bacterium]|nr:30S ribosomal protein S1 [Candidatus Omnitrophota bacterium]
MVEEKKDTSLEELYNQSLKNIKEGQIVKGKIVSITGGDVLVDIGYKSEGVIPLREFPGSDKIAVGQETDVLVEMKEDDDGRIVLSKEKADKIRGWRKLVDDFNENTLVEGKIRKKVKGGFIVDVFGADGFLPMSLSSFKNMTDDEIINKNFKFHVTKLNKIRHSLILSRRDALQKEKELTKGKLWDSLEVGKVRSGTVKGITDFGAFIDLGGIDGLLHITDMSWSRISHPSELVAIGDKIDVVILGFDKDASKISLGLKQRTPDPWQEVENKFPMGSRVKGKVVNIMPYGVFIELEKGIEGLVHYTEMSWQKRTVNPQEMFAIGDIVEVQVLNIDREAKRISLSVKQLESNPWLEAEKKFPVGSLVTGKVRGFTDYGAFVELDENLEGMIHISDMSWTKKINHPQDIFRKGQKIELKILSVDVENRKISLGLKQLTDSPWPEIAKKYPIGMALDSEVVQITSFGVFVKIEEDLEGLVYSSEIDKEAMAALKPQDKLKVKVIKVDVEQMKIGLSSKNE